MTTVLMQCNFCKRGHTLDWFLPVNDEGDLGKYVCSAYLAPKGIPDEVELGTGDCPKFGKKSVMSDDDTQLFADIYPYMV